MPYSSESGAFIIIISNSVSSSISLAQAAVCAVRTGENLLGGSIFAIEAENEALEETINVR